MYRDIIPRSWAVRVFFGWGGRGVGRIVPRDVMLTISFTPFFPSVRLETLIHEPLRTERRNREAK